ncbi:MAG: DUF3467 domain-containing protein [Bacteroidota bacterium]|nr:DUF3467 domain-containing protein [Bacteroidota bacterium]
MANTKNQKDKKEQEQAPLQILANPETQKGVYSNVALVHHSDNEFILDFLFKIEGDPQLVSRVVLSPDHMERLVGALTENLQKFKDNKIKKDKK